MCVFFSFKTILLFFLKGGVCEVGGGSGKMHCHENYSVHLPRLVQRYRQIDRSSMGLNTARNVTKFENQKTTSIFLLRLSFVSLICQVIRIIQNLMWVPHTHKELFFVVMLNASPSYLVCHQLYKKFQNAVTMHANA